MLSAVAVAACLACVALASTSPLSFRVYNEGQGTLFLAVNGEPQSSTIEPHHQILVAFALDLATYPALSVRCLPWAPVNPRVGNVQS